MELVEKRDGSRRHSSPDVDVCSFLRKMDLCAGRAPAYAVYETAASLPMLAEREKWLPGHESHMRSRLQRPLSYC
jgi:hypothetical protein